MPYLQDVPQFRRLEKQKTPAKQSWSGLTTGVYVHVVGVRKGESYRLTLRWKQVIAPRFTRVGYLVSA
jgi:hypothetical protein